MILPIVAYGHPTLKAIAKDIDKDFPELEKLIADMWETLAHSSMPSCLTLSARRCLSRRAV